MLSPYYPETLPLKNVRWEKIVSLISKANRMLASYDGVLQSIINSEVLLSPLFMQEAVLSSKIEGTQATLEEVFEYEAVQYAENDRKYEDIQEILNYRSAMELAINELKQRPLSLNLILKIHETLMNSVRGFDKRRGEFRKTQNWIGSNGSSIGAATFVPPKPTDLKKHLDNLENYIHFEDEDPLVQAAIIHAQFELIHPFMDGNGRVGRILIPLFLYEKKIISRPMFYISAYLEANRDEYYLCLQMISKEGNWNKWINFFLNATIVQAKENKEKASQIQSLYNEWKLKIPQLTHSQHSMLAVDQIFAHPIFTSTDFVERSKIPKATAMRILKMLEKEKLIDLFQVGKGRAPNIYIFSKLLRIAHYNKIQRQL